MLWRHDKFHANDGVPEIYDGIWTPDPFIGSSFNQLCSGDYCPSQKTDKDK